MSLQCLRRELLRAGVVAVTSFHAGCAATDGQQTPTTGPHLSNNTAEEAALDAETDFVESSLSDATCLDGWDIGKYDNPSARAVERTDSEVIVVVERPYSYTNASEQVVTQRSKARYVVTVNGTRRITGTMREPCR